MAVKLNEEGKQYRVKKSHIKNVTDLDGLTIMKAYEEGYAFIYDTEIESFCMLSLNQHNKDECINVKVKAEYVDIEVVESVDEFNGYPLDDFEDDDFAVEEELNTIEEVPDEIDETYAIVQEERIYWINSHKVHNHAIDLPKGLVRVKAITTKNDSVIAMEERYVDVNACKNDVDKEYYQNSPYVEFEYIDSKFENQAMNINLFAGVAELRPLDDASDVQVHFEFNIYPTSFKNGRTNCNIPHGEISVKSIIDLNNNYADDQRQFDKCIARDAEEEHYFNTCNYIVFEYLNGSKNTLILDINSFLERVTVL